MRLRFRVFITYNTCKAISLTARQPYHLSIGLQAVVSQAWELEPLDRFHGYTL